MKLSPVNLLQPIASGFDAPCAARAGLVRSPVPAERAPEAAAPRAEAVRSIDPMLLVYQERVETFRLIGAALQRAWHALARRAVAGARQPKSRSIGARLAAH